MALSPTSSRGSSGSSGVTILNYTAYTASVTISAATEAASNTVVTASAALTVDGSTLICVEFYAAKVVPAANDAVTLSLWNDAAGGTELGRIATVSAGTQAPQVPVLVRRYFTPSAGTYTYSVRGFRFSANGTVTAGSGGVAGEMPGYIRITSGS